MKDVKNKVRTPRLTRPKGPLLRVAAVVDHYDRDASGWRIVERPTAQVAVDALEMGVAERKGEYLRDLEIRSDGGPQFTAHQYARTTERLGLRHTVTPARWPNDNPFAEAFFGAFNANPLS